MKETPVSKKKNFILSLVILFGESLTIVNGAYVPNKIRSQAKKYPEIAKKLINAGWIAQYPCPNQNEFESLMNQYEIENNDVTFTELDISNQSNDFEFEEEEIEEFDTDKVLQEYILMEQKVFLKTLEQAEDFLENEMKDIPIQDNIFTEDSIRMSKSAKNMNGNLSDNNEVSFRDKIQLILASYGHEVDQNKTSRSILEIVEDLLKMREAINRVKQNQTESQEKSEDTDTKDTNEQNIYEDDKAIKSTATDLPKDIDQILKDENSDEFDFGYDNEEEDYLRNSEFDSDGEESEPPLTEEELALANQEIKKYELK
ncbi:hypothetical protein TVAG_318680 [Trichomonas vaginalis G3]|uniref:Uncharacterized protein n=1 Tax=Trichomonas vaginalis (strain ATCC PRA-98 / G3) TaxID=412133 RepID=A2G5L8_TRIV3|nr:hypothetical protein TVAGG3_0662300 [Trichomonas vaginalis G3]EAX87553.1 hypothetical protein TVAG_318680 [Trichomonas vaginalis G3]KAI5506581.1 hypothetical protein TVAGG3_0662300 [Trichomonas vaginalis G3]|eukprot:XP_001300483.1 hypothetical protein [Trichomonas vaginalis G3]